MQTIEDRFDGAATLNRVRVPDLWQQEAVAALRQGSDVVVHAPTGAGKTLIFELWSNEGRNHGQAIFTVPTRALANDKLAEWRARDWNVGIATGDLAENLSAPVLVATLETQKNRLIAGDGPELLVVDEYQMIGDPDRGLNYELAIALAPPRTQLLLMSGSVHNPQDVAKWLQRLGRHAVVVRHEERPVPLEEVFVNHLSYRVPSSVRGYWPRFVAKALAENLGPILLFAPRRAMAESLAAELARTLPNPDPLELSPVQKQLVDSTLARMLKSRIAYHHSGLSYAARAGVVEPLAKAGQLRVVVATMGLAAGINFSLRSVALAGDSYRRDAAERALRPDEILQMFGRAGRRGIDEIGYVLVAANEIRLYDGHAAHLSRNGMVDWGALLGLMHAAADQGREPFPEAVRVQERLFTAKPIFLGVEQSMKNPNAPCGLHTDAERARHVRRRVREMLNSRGEWERYPPPVSVPLGELRLGQAVGLPEALDGKAADNHSTAAAVTDGLAPEGATFSALPSILSEPKALAKTGHGVLCVLDQANGSAVYGREMVVAERLRDSRVLIQKWVRRLTGWNGRQASLKAWRSQIAPLVEKRMAGRNMPVVQFRVTAEKIHALVSLAHLTMKAPVDRHGVALWHPHEREIFPPDCAACSLVSTCRTLSGASGTATLWRRLGLVDAAGAPTVRGRIVGFFSQGDGLAIAAAIEDESYPLDELIYDLANLDAGFRFAGDENRWEGRLAMVSRRAYGVRSIDGYLENGVPPQYGSGAEQVVASVHRNPLAKTEWITPWLGTGDIDRIIIEWRSQLRQVAHAPELDLPRWRAFRELARAVLRETESPTLVDLPPLEYHQTKRRDHRLILRRH